MNEPTIRTTTHVVYAVAGSVREPLFSGSLKECLEHVSLFYPDYTCIDQNDFEWSVEIEEEVLTH